MRLEDIIRSGICTGLCGIGLALSLAPPAQAVVGDPPAPPVNVLTQRYDNRRTGANLRETILNTSNVNPPLFGKLWSYPVDGHVYAQPLYVQGINVSGTTRNVVYIATMHNTVYAYDADRAPSGPLWSVNLGPSVLLDSNLDIGWACFTRGMYHNVSRELGITSTPVIDLETNTMYVVAKTKSNMFPLFGYRDAIHALDITTGSEKMAGPTTISASSGRQSIDSQTSNQRASLLLANNRVYVAFGSYCDTPIYTGWVLGYPASNLSQAPVVWASVAPDSDFHLPGGGAGVWMAGTGPAADGAGNVYVITGNGNFNADTLGQRYGTSFVKLDSNLVVQDWFSPYNQAQLSDHDIDLGSAGPLLIPGTNLVTGAGKEGRIYLLDTGSLGNLSANDRVIKQRINHAFGLGDDHHLHGTPVYWNGPDGPTTYWWAENTVLKVYRFNGNQFDTPPADGAISAPDGMPGGFLAISANGSQPGSGILWSSMPKPSVNNSNTDANNAVVPGILRAFDASYATTELWNSEVNPTDTVGDFAKFVPPTVANGKVYLATFSNRVLVYGLLSTSTPPPTPTPDPGPRGYYPSAIIGSYYNDVPPDTEEIEVPIYWDTFTTFAFFRLDSTIDFSTGTGSPAPGVNGTFWSARWKGQIYVPQSGNYTFYLTNLDDGGRLWVDNTSDSDVPLIESWRVQGYHDYQSSPILLAAGPHDFRVDYVQGPPEGGALTVQWSSDFFEKETIGPYTNAVPTLISTSTSRPVATATPTATPTPTPTSTPSPTFTPSPSPTTPTPTPTPDNCWCPIFWLFGWCQPASAQSVSGRVSTLQAVRTAADDLQLFYRVRDEVLATTHEGRQLTALYNQHGPEVTRLLRTDPVLASEARALIHVWTPSLQALVQRRSDQAIFTRTQVAATQRFVAHLSVTASPAFKQDMARTLARHALGTLVGKSIRDALHRDHDERDHDGGSRFGHEHRKK